MTVMHKSGFSLMELVIAIAILGIMAVLVGPRLISFLGFAKEGKAKTELNTIQEAVLTYYGLKSEYPKELVNLTTGKRPLLDPDKANIQNGKVSDPWDQAYQYRVTKGGKHPFELYSLGDPDAPERLDVWKR